MIRDYSQYHSHLERKIQVMEYAPQDKVWVLFFVGGGKKRRIIKRAGTVDRPLYSKVLVRWKDAQGVTHIRSISPDRLERRND